MYYIDIKDYLESVSEQSSEDSNDILNIPVWDVKCNRIKIVRNYLPITTICNKKLI